jgi:hypothetical protein
MTIRQGCIYTTGYGAAKRENANNDPQGLSSLFGNFLGGGGGAGGQQQQGGIGNLVDGLVVVVVVVVETIKIQGNSNNKRKRAD